MILTKTRAVTGITVATSLTDLVVFDTDQPNTGDRNALLGNYSLCNIEVKNTDGADAFDQFRVLMKYHESGDWQTVLDTGDYAATGNTLLYVSTPPDVLAAGATALLHLFIGCPYALKIQAAGAAAAAAEIRTMLAS